MIKTLLILNFCTISLFSIFSSSSNANNKWIYIVTDSRGYKFHLNNSSIRKQGDKIAYEQMIEFNKPTSGMTAYTSKFNGSCKTRMAVESNHAGIVKGQSKPIQIKGQLGYYLEKNTEMGKVLTSACQFKSIR